MQQLSLSVDYIANEEIHLQVKTLLTLAFSPPNHVIDAFKQLHMDNTLKGLVDYFEETFIGNVDVCAKIFYFQLRYGTFMIRSITAYQK